MYCCPACGARSITFMQKWWSWSASPAPCKVCGKGCAIAIVDSSGIQVAAILLVTAGGFFALALQSRYPLCLGVALAVAYYLWRQHRAPLMVITEAEAKTAKRSAWIGLLVALFPSFFS
jgi:hypothetical protein